MDDKNKNMIEKIIAVIAIIISGAFRFFRLFAVSNAILGIAMIVVGVMEIKKRRFFLAAILLCLGMLSLVMAIL